MGSPSEQKFIVIIPKKGNAVDVCYLSDCFKGVPALLTRTFPETHKSNQDLGSWQL